MGEHQARRFMLTGEGFLRKLQKAIGMLNGTSTTLIDVLDACIDKLIKSFKACSPMPFESQNSLFAAAHNLIDQPLIANTVVCTARVRPTTESKEAFRHSSQTKPSWF
jgi:hypothetical protein